RGGPARRPTPLGCGRLRRAGLEPEPRPTLGSPNRFRVPVADRARGASRGQRGLLRRDPHSRATRSCAPSRLASESLPRTEKRSSALRSARRCGTRRGLHLEREARRRSRPASGYRGRARVARPRNRLGVASLPGEGIGLSGRPRGALPNERRQQSVTAHASQGGRGAGLDSPPDDRRRSAGLEPRSVRPLGLVAEAGVGAGARCRSRARRKRARPRGGKVSPDLLSVDNQGRRPGLLVRILRRYLIAAGAASTLLFLWLISP